MSSLDHTYEHRCCWNCRADNYHAAEPDEGPCFQALVVCYEQACPTRQKWEDYSDPLLDESEWHFIADGCSAWMSADGIFPSTLIEAAS